MLWIVTVASQLLLEKVFCLVLGLCIRLRGALLLPWLREVLTQGSVQQLTVASFGAYLQSAFLSGFQVVGSAAAYPYGTRPLRMASRDQLPLPVSGEGMLERSLRVWSPRPPQGGPPEDVQGANRRRAPSASWRRRNGMGLSRLFCPARRG